MKKLLKHALISICKYTYTHKTKEKIQRQNKNRTAFDTATSNGNNRMRNKSRKCRCDFQRWARDLDGIWLRATSASQSMIRDAYKVLNVFTPDSWLEDKQRDIICESPFDWIGWQPAKPSGWKKIICNGNAKTLAWNWECIFLNRKAALRWQWASWWKRWRGESTKPH